MLRRLYHDQPAGFAFTPANLAWAEGQITKYPAGRQASAIIPLLWRAQEQQGWLTRAAIEHVADMLGLAYIRALEVATFYFMFQLQPTGSIAHIQICGTTSCMICGAEDLIAVCRDKISPRPYTLSADGKFTWEEVECLGACANAPAAQIGKDYYEDLTAEQLRSLLGELASGAVPVPGPQNGRFSSEPASGLTSLKAHDSGRTRYNASVQLAVDLGETVKRIDGTEVPLLTPWLNKAAPVTEAVGETEEPTPGEGLTADETGITVQEAGAESAAEVPEQGGSAEAPSDAPVSTPEAPMPTTGAEAETPASAAAHEVETPADAADAPEVSAPSAADMPSTAMPAAADLPAGKPAGLTEARGGVPDDLKLIEGIGPKIQRSLNGFGVYHFDQIAAWTEADIAWIDANLPNFPGRASRDRWVSQARIICEEGREAFLIRAKTNDY
ncbi:NADH-quinone oxidoreductase subunit E [Frigidibacter sp.]|uniref:NADH-quinone oxidoreductase subunit E n=1 Tax=Frigidibacter sp. TaxID=2586418 RepID=UPI002736EFEF|nr:NADH-quinone oxidoreductase subunit E [Frigidibacter sp.]MDP3340321.1 NADH-quinone oxidoreductase subunit E [Frigidibacter sp.]